MTTKRGAKGYLFMRHGEAPHSWSDCSLTLAATAFAMISTLAMNPFQFTWGFSTDAFAYLAHAHQLLHDGAFNMGGKSDFSLVDGQFLAAGTPNFYTPPLYIAMLAAGLRIWNDWRVALFENALFFAAATFYGLKILARQTDQRLARFAFTAGMAFDPAYLLYNGGVQLDTPAAALTMAFLFFWLGALRQPHANPIQFVFAGLLGAATCLTRGNMLPVIGLTGLIAVLSYVPSLSYKQLIGVALTASICAILLAGWAWRTEQITGRWSATGSGNAGMMLSLNFSLTGPRAPHIKKAWSDQQAAAYAHRLKARGDPPLHIESEMDQEWAHQVMRYVSAHKRWALQVFSVSAIRMFLASEFSEPALIATRFGGDALANMAANIYVFGSRGLLLVSFIGFPLLIWRSALAKEFFWIWIATLAFILLTAFVAPGADRYRLPVEPLCVLFLALWVSRMHLLITHRKSRITAGQD